MTMMLMVKIMMMVTMTTVMMNTIMTKVMKNLYTPPLAPTRQTLGSRREVANEPANTFIIIK